MDRRLLILLLACSGWLSGLVGCKKAEPPDDHSEVSSFEPFPEDGGQPESERWYLFELQGKPTGWLHARFTRHQTSRGVRWVASSEELIIVHRGAEKIQSRTLEKHLENQSGQLLRFWQMVQEQDGEKVVIQAGKVKTDLITVRGPEIRRVPFESQALARHHCFKFLLGRETPKSGNVKNFRSYDPSQAGYADNRIVVKSAGPGGTKLEHTTSSLPGIITLVRLDADFLIDRAEFQIGAMQLVQRRVEKKPVLEDEGAAVDIDPLMVVPSNVPIENPRAAVLAKYRIEGLPDHVDSDWFSGPGQKALKNPAPGTFVIKVEKLDDPPPAPFPQQPQKPELSKYLASTALTRLDDPEIKKTARKATAGAPDAWTAARRLRRWVSEEIEGSMGMGFASASQTLKNREGDCSEQSVLLAALARSAGIPARCVMGLVYQDGSFFRHMWTEVWVGRWQPLDPAQATDYISAAWIRLAVHSLQLTDDQKSGGGALVLFGAKLKVTVEEIEAPRR